MQYYRIGETLEPLESLPPEEKSILAVLCPEELPGALLPLPVPAISVHASRSPIWIASQPCSMINSSSASDGLVMVQPYFS